MSQQTRHRNAKNGDSVGGWLPGCLLQLVIVSLLVAAGGFAARLNWPAHSFAEAALLTAAIALLYAVGVGIFGLWVRRWPLVNELTCGDCGYRWVEELPAKRHDPQRLRSEKSTG
jgi:hypothetical protein